MADHIYDLIIIGAGPAGYTAALRAAAMGQNAENEPTAPIRAA